MSGHLVHIANPLAPAIGLSHFDDAAGLTVTEAIVRSGWTLPPSTVLLRPGVALDAFDLNGEDLRALLVPRAQWDCVVIGEDDGVALITLPLGGNGAGSQILRIVALIALTIVSYGAAAYLLGADLAATVAFAGVTYGQLVTVGITLAGQLLISALMPPPKSFSGGPGQSPTYSLSAQSNQARLGSAVPEQGGRHIIYPDLAAAPYQEYDDDNQQVILELFCVGCGDLHIHQVRIDTNVVWEEWAYTGTYSNIEVEVVDTAATVSLFPDNVVTSSEVSSIELKGPNQDGVGGYVYDWSGPFVASGPGTIANYISIDVVLPAGLIQIGSQIHNATATWTVEGQLIDATGTPLGGWVTIDDLSDSLSLADRDPIRKTYRAKLSDYGLEGRVQIRAERTDDSHNAGSEVTDTLYWSAMRAYLPGVQDYGDRTMVALRAAASANLNGTSAQKLNIIATRMLPLYDRVTKVWSARTATRSIAAMASHICRSSNGLGKSDSEIDLDTLWLLDETWTARGDTFDGIFDIRQSGWEALQSVLRCGRAKAVRAGTQITFVRDEPKTIPRAPFGPGNMEPDSFSTKFVFPKAGSVEAMLVIFIDERTWTQNQVLVALPGSTVSADDAPQVQAFGMTQREQVWREYIYQLAQSAYRRTFPGFRTALDGRVCQFGDLVVVSHWLASWGATAEILSLTRDDAGDILTISEPWSPTIDPAAPTLLARISTPDGRVYGPATVDILDAGDNDGQAQLRLTSISDAAGKYAGQQPRDWPVWSDQGLQMERPRILLGTGSEVPQDALIVSMLPQADDKTTVLTVLEDARVHDADLAGAPVEVSPPPGAVPEDLTITNVAIGETQANSQSSLSKIGVSIAGAPDARSFQYQMAWDPTSDYGPIRFAPDRSFVLQGEDGTLRLKARAIGASGSGDWYTAAPFTASGTVGVAPADVGAISTIIAWSTGNSGEWQWPNVTGATSYSIDVQAKVLPGDPWTSVRSATSSLNSYTYQASFETPDGGPFNSLRIRVKAVNAAGSSTNWSYST